MTQAHAFLFPNCEFSQGFEFSETALPSTLSRHLKALRIRTGESVSFLNGRGRIVNTVCSSARPYTFRVNDIEEHASASPRIHLYLSPPRRDTLSQTLSQSTEMGVSEITFLLSDHNDYSQKEREPVVERSRRVLEAAVEQCRAPHLPQINETWVSVGDALKTLKGPAFFADEDLSRSGTLGLTPAANFKPHDVLALFIGPEGGWSPKERDLMSQSSDVSPLGLGPRILKVPTACVAALYQIQLLSKGNTSR